MFTKATNSKGWAVSLGAIFIVMLSVLADADMTIAPPAPPDSISNARDPFRAPSHNSVLSTMNGSTMDTTTPVLEAVKLSTQGAFTNLTPKVGDSLDYVLQVEWKDNQVPVIVLPPDSLSFSGFKMLGQATIHKKLAVAEDIKNHTEFIYHLRAQVQGNGRAASMKIRYLTGLSHSEEAIFIPTALVDILPAPVRILDMLWFKLVAGLILLGGAISLAWLVFKFTLKSRKPTEILKVDFKSDLVSLKSRLRTASSSPDVAKEILLQMENICLRFLQQEVPVNTNIPANGTPEKFEPLLASYLSRNGTLPDSEVQDWSKLKDLFRHAHFAGGFKEPHELQDALRILKRCLKIMGEDEHE